MRVSLFSLAVSSSALPADSKSRVLIATPLKDAAESLPWYFEALDAVTYPKELISIGFLESDSTDLTDKVVRTFIASDHPYRRVYYKSIPSKASVLGEKHDLDLQLQRRKVLAQARNDLLALVDMNDFDYVLWIDVDSFGFPPSIIEDLISVNRSVVAPNILGANGGTYDLNSWFETQPMKVWADPHAPVMFEGYSEFDSYGGRLYLSCFRDKLRDDEKFAIVPLHGVGTALLMVDAAVHRAGIIFPIEPYKRRVESEGFGLIANDRGFSVVGLPNYLVVH